MTYLERLKNKPLEFYVVLGASGLVFGSIVKFFKKNQIIGVGLGTIISSLMQNYAFEIEDVKIEKDIDLP